MPDYYASPDRIAYTFNNWTWDSGSSTSRTITPTVNAHTTYTANYTGTALADTMHIKIASVNGEPIRLEWMDHPNSGVTKYQVWRWIKYYSDPIDVSGDLYKGTTSFTDNTYIQSYTGRSLFYTVKAYYSPSGTWNDPGYFSVSGNQDLQSIVADNGNKKLDLANKEVPNEYSISNYPNPFNPSTVIKYNLPKDGYVTLKVYDILGKEIATLVNENKQAGYYNATFNASNLPSGIYIYSIKAGGYSQSKKMILTK